MGLTREGLANICNIDFDTIGKIERGERSPNSYTLFHLTRVLNMDLEKLRQEVEEDIKHRDGPSVCFV